MLGQQASAQFFYGIRQTFGKNRMQYNQFDWVFQRYERFDIYFYRGNDELAEQVARMTGKNLVKIENLLDSPLDERVQILVFNNLSDLKQSNVNSNDDEDYNTGGVTRISGRRMFLYFDGDYSKLEGQLRSGLTDVVLSNMVYGSFTESIQNSTLLNLPSWYTEGLISYIGNPNSIEADTWARDGILTGKYKKLSSLTGTDATYAGHSFWNFIAQTYGQKILKNLIYLSIINRNIESGFQFILGKNLTQITEGWVNFYKQKYDQSKREPFPEEEFKKFGKKYIVTRMESSKNGRYLAYVSQKFSQYKVYIYDFEEDKKKRILKGGYKIAQNTDYSYPIMAWHPNNKILAMFTEKKGFIYLTFYNAEQEELEEKQFFRFDKILSFEYSKDGKQFLISGVKDGQSDIFIYTILNTKIEQLTNDTYNDLYPTFINNGERVVFSSNRPSNVLIKDLETFDFPIATHDLFSMPASEPEQDTTTIWQMTSSPNIEELKAQEYEDGYVAFLSNRNEVQNRHIIKIDSSIAYVDTITHYDYSFKEYSVTNYNRNVLDEIYSPERDRTYTLMLKDKRYRIFETEFFDAEQLELKPVEQPKLQRSATNNTQTLEPSDSIGVNTNQQISRTNNVPLYYPGIDYKDFEIDINNYQFDDENELKKVKKKKTKVQIQPVAVNQPSEPTVAADTASAKDEDKFKIPPKRNYFLSFYQDDFTVKFDNIFDNPQYQRFTGFVSSDFLNAGFNMQLKVGVIDLMHDYRIIAGLRTNFQPLRGTSITPNAEYFLALTDYKKRLDKEYVYSRRSQIQFNSIGNINRIISNEFRAKASWPFSPVASIRGELGYRLDEDIVLQREALNPLIPTEYDHFAIARASFVYDNSRKIGLNLYAGMRYKIFTEYYRRLGVSNSGLHTLGLDFRHYTVIHRNMIWANRFATGTSFGPEKLIYFMGGTDNAFSPKFDPTTPIAEENNYIFQTLVTNMRGLFQNVRNGNSFALVNTEIRWPIFSYLANRPLRSDFFQNFQIIGFTDVGTAWNGPSPYSEENAINTRTINRNSVKIVLDSQREPIVVGMGFGLRARLFGYFMRFDWGWGIDSGVLLPSEFTFSLSTDF
jgi:WD40 repeat protein